MSTIVGDELLPNNWWGILQEKLPLLLQFLDIFGKDLLPNNWWGMLQKMLLHMVLFLDIYDNNCCLKVVINCSLRNLGENTAMNVAIYSTFWNRCPTIRDKLLPTSSLECYRKCWHECCHFCLFHGNICWWGIIAQQLLRHVEKMLLWMLSFLDICWWHLLVRICYLTICEECYKNVTTNIDFPCRFWQYL